MNSADLKQLIKRLATSLFNILGIHATFALKRSKSDLCVVDRNAVEPFFSKDERVSLYYEGLKIAQQEHTDNIYKQCRSYTLQQMVKYTLDKNIPGDVAECGCWKGQSSYIISTILKQGNFTGQFQIFDSFEGGLSDKNANDDNLRLDMSDQEIKYEKESFSSSEADLHRALKKFNFYTLYKGWIPTRFPEVADHTYRFAHIDVDLHQPTKDSLEFFWPRLSTGGVIIVDDYGYTQFPGAKKAVDEFLADKTYSMLYAYPLGGCFIIK